MQNVQFNKCQTPLEELQLETYPQEVQDQFWDFLNNVPFIKWMVSPDRPMVSELPRDEEGRAIIDITHPPILEGSDYFRPSALFYKANKGRYTNLKPNRNPNSDFMKWLKEERKRGWEGYINPDTGMWVDGDYYWELNYCPMHLVEKREDGLDMRVVAHPRFWDGQFLMSHYVSAARRHGHHAATLASRGRGKTSYGAAKLAKRCIIGETKENQVEVQCMVTAVDRTKLMDTNQILSVFKDNLNHCAKTTQFASRRLKSSDQEMEWRMGYKKPGSEVEYGSKNSVSGIITGVNQDKLNGSRGVLYLIEEAGIFKNLLSMYAMIRPSVEQGKSVFGEIYLYGCVCAGTKVWTNNGRYINIEDLCKEDGIIGYENDLPVKNTIGTLLEPRIKPCIRITYTNGKYLECSTDHPILTQVIHTPRIKGSEKRKRTSEEVWKRADELKVGDKILEGRYIGAFGTDTLEDARLVGMLLGDGSYGQTKGNKRLPINYQTLTEEDTKLLLAGLYDTDGYITGEGNATSISLTQSTREILEQIAILLRKFGIVSSIAKNKPSIKEGRIDKHPWYILQIGGRTNIEIFYDNIPLLQQRKKEKLERVCQWFKEHPITKTRCYDDKKIIPRTIQKIEGIGEQTIYNLSAEQSHTYLANNIITHNTAGDDQSDFTAFAEMFYSPDGYNEEPLDNVFDKEGQGRKQCCFFYGAYLNYDDSCIDENGNSDVTKALLSILYDRYKVKYGSTDVNTLVKRISQYPIVPQEAMIKSHGNIFPITELNERLNQIDNNPNEYDETYIGELVQDNKTGEVKFNPTYDTPIRDFPTKDNKIQGALEIFEMPKKDSEGKVPFGRYICSCLKEGELVNTASGKKPVEQVTLEDKLINIEGDFVEIKNLQKYYNTEPVYKVQLHNRLTTTVFSSEHPIYCSTPKRRYHEGHYAKRANLPYRYFEYNFDFRKVSELKVGDVVKTPNMYRKELPYMHYWEDYARIDRQIENPLNKEDFWWLLGVIIGDGWACNNGYTIRIIFNSQEVEYIEKAKSIIQRLFNRSVCYTKDMSNCKELSFCLQTLNAFIKKNIGCGARNKKLAEWIKYIPLNLKKQLLLGYLASDGCLTTDKIEYVSISLQLLNDMQDILMSLGIPSAVNSIYVTDNTTINGRRVNNEKNKYHLRIGKAATKEIVSWNPSDLKLRKYTYPELLTIHDRKKMWFSNDLKYVYIKVASIEVEEYVGNIYNFECATHTFMCDWIPTHNCDPYDSDVSNTMSLGSILVMDLWTDMIVAEYTGRPAFAEDFYEICRKLCLFYNTRCMYEQNIMGMFSYFSSHNSSHLLAETPEYLVQRNMISSIGYGNKSVGIRATTPIINGAFKMIQTWLRKPIPMVKTDGEENTIEVTMPNLYRIKNRALLKELVLWNPQGNYDRVMSLVQLMLYREEKLVLYQGDLNHAEGSGSGIEADTYWDKNYPGKKKVW